MTFSLNLHGHSKHLNGFTLVELLTVIAIIAILGLILLPVLGSVRERAKVTTATSDVKQIANAWRIYYVDRRSWPDPQDFESGDSVAKSSERADGEVFWNAYVKLLSGDFDPGTDAALARNNPSATAYLPLRPAQIDQNGEFVDPWGNPYKFKLDKRYSGPPDAIVDSSRTGDLRIGRFDYGEYGDPDNPSDEQIIIEDTVLAWSRGPDEEDHNPEMAEDDPKSW